MRRQTVLDQGIASITVAIAAENFLVDCHVRQVSPTTAQFYRKKLKRFVIFCEAQAATALEQVDADVLRRFFLWLEESGNNPGGRHAYFRALRAFFRWLENEFEGYTSPLRKLRPPKVDVLPIEGVSLNDVQALLETCRDRSFVSVRDRALILFLLDTGTRIGECLALNWDDIDLVGGSVLIRRGKNRKPRVVFLGRTARQALRAYTRMRKDTNPAVWVTIHGERMRYDGVRDMLRRRAKQASLSSIPTPHDFRRACALALLRNGANVVSVSRLLGHSSLEVTKRYLAQNESDLHQAHSRFSPVDGLRKK
ncbi:tyrosine-type recombinase/integrase [Anaerolinea sp.]|uniref:tyrosine-type recombinase/integrase n=1 Tax=Anaerolinea sp. TaxID=1872519 RepID=UPI002ACED5DC|nr:tyrosine-type recombinase/integrase [Anaerolinea sp.]